MLFNIDESYTYTTTKESKYELGIGGALMHVYENECNYNALMKAVGISELRYYTENGKDLFVHEAGAFKKFTDAIKKFFKAIIDKIVSIFNKLKNFLSGKVMDDEKFIKKYEDQLKKADLSGFKFEGYAFPKLSAWKPVDTQLDAELEKILDIDKTGSITVADEVGPSQETKDMIESARGNLIKGLDGGGVAVDKAKFAEILNKNLVGEKKQELTGIDINTTIAQIKSAKKDIKEAQDTQKYLCDIINRYIKALEKSEKEIEKDDANKDAKIKKYNKMVEIEKAHSNDITVLYGAIAKAYKTRNIQNKAICVKALSYKPNKDKTVATPESVYDLFSSVVIN